MILSAFFPLRLVLFGDVSSAAGPFFHVAQRHVKLIKNIVMGLHIHLMTRKEPKFSIIIALSLFNGREWKEGRERGF